ncbi:tRNA dimethylallyltransferase [Actinomycetales bacterium JB111]|nr:tRNA dimethylallyltransferase [Actinomycetales bacterium JB111]
MRAVAAIVGPTASGKSDLALDVVEALAARVGVPSPEYAEVVSSDAVQLYRGMDIGTAKLPTDERRGIAHHQLDVLDPGEDASVAAFQRFAEADIDRIVDRGRRPVVVGGSGLYVRAVLDDVDLPPTDPAVRARIERRAEEIGASALHAELAATDPAAAEAILPGNVRRVVRALEVIELTGETFSSRAREPRYRRPTVQIAIDVPREELDARIAARAEAMVAGGLVEEVAGLVRQGIGRTAGRAVGYVETMAHLRGELPLDELAGAIAAATRKLARRQLSWFRRDARVAWLAPGPSLVDGAVALIDDADAAATTLEP